MAEYIEREAIIAAIMESKNENPHTNGTMRVMHNHEHMRFLRMVATQPAADVVPVVHGKWTPYGIGKGMSFCSKCEYNGKREYRYCPYCGAEMDKPITPKNGA